MQYICLYAIYIHTYTHRHFLKKKKETSDDCDKKSCHTRFLKLLYTRTHTNVYWYQFTNYDVNVVAAAAAAAAAAAVQIRPDVDTSERRYVQLTHAVFASKLLNAYEASSHCTTWGPATKLN
jgi:hypothetical protein